ncbi:unnamed protein product [Bursaphelenchus okinawaensis]|uniref:glutamine--fructose-6-phosphate transaminase (isomerizing) n=1 Tax=Bursaphelenchus okinawaensis TaxID=465554 RepID=A0A811KJX8_9BILA|nr:unnamed protein product [Bursaphelenchus okinawaensis]CAG9105240.1 unnamed protein product [Bursaphelenchus okinawaensis]
MCGIFGYVNFMLPKKREEIIQILLNGLRRMEYRGYDSAGLAVDVGNDSLMPTDGIRVLRCQGKVDDLENYIKEDGKDMDMERVFNIHAGIAHTRWATHGQPTDLNSHPQRSDKDNAFVCVHNGIITNYRELKQYLTGKGYAFESETDSEVVVKLAKYVHDKYPSLSFRQIVEITVNELEGAFALVFKSRLYPGQVVATRKGSPLVVGIRCEKEDRPVTYQVQLSKAKTASFDDTFRMDQTPNGTPHSGNIRSSGINNAECSFKFDQQVEYFFASDASAIVEHTKHVLYLEDDDIATVKCGDLAIHRVRGTEYAKPEVRFVEELHMKMDEIMRGEFKTFMQKEIFEQPESVVNTMRGRVQSDGTVCLGGVKNNLKFMDRSCRFIFIACGTSYNSAVAASRLLEELCNVAIQLELASDFMDRNVAIKRSDVCIFVSQSGETADTLAALKYCKEKGAFMVGITNTVGSAISRETDCGIHLNAGPEIGVASTKAYTSQILAMVMLSVSLAQSWGIDTAKTKKIVKELNKLQSYVKKVLLTDHQVMEIAKTIYREKSVLVMGRGYNFATCLEGALKIKELSYMHCEGILSGELKHGPLAMVDENQCIIMIICSDSVYKKSLNALQQVLARGGRPIVIADEEVDEKELQGVSEVIRVPKTVECLQTILTVIPLQLMSYHVADLNGFNVDRPRNLAKSVTVE